MAFQDGFKKFPEISTERLQLKQLQPDNAEDYFKGLETVDPTVWGLRPESIEATKVFLSNGIKGYAAKGNIRWGIYHQNKLIGEVRVFDFVYQSKAEISYWIIQGERKKGFGTEALEAVVQFCFEVLNLHRIEAIVRPDNLASLSLVKKAGFQQEGILRKYRNEGGRNGIWNDSVVLSKLHDDR